jgi:Undecaprenyl-phosphate glucose phosphotransferase
MQPSSAIAAETSAASEQPHRRGVLRPKALMPVRRRLSSRGIAAFYAIGDACIGLGLAAFLGGWALAGVTILQLLAMRFVGAYDVVRRGGVRRLRRIALALVVIGLAALAVRLPVSPLGLAAVAATLLAASAGWTALTNLFHGQGRLTPNLMVVGATPAARRLIERLTRTGEAAVLGVFDDRADRAPKDVAGVPVLGDLSALIGHRLTPFVDRIVVAVPKSAESRVAAMFERLNVLPNDILVLLDDDDVGPQERRSADRIAALPLARLSGQRTSLGAVAAKRAQDLVIGAIALAVFAPVMLVIALLVKLDSPGPVFFRQKRHGFHNESILVWKFRSMRQEAADATAAQQVKYGDERVTRLGRFIRRTSLDELPQLFNVLRGEMSLVGPRPHAIGMKTGAVESAALVAHYAHRHRMKPGMTGWAAIHGSRGPVDTPELVRERVRLDVEYIERQSFRLDLYIMAMTLPCLVGDRKKPR